MIVKKVKCKKSSKPKAWQIGDLVDYIRYPHNTNAYEKIAHAGSRNFLSGTHTGQKIEMISLSQESVHSKMPVSHWVFSWQEHEQPTRAQVDELVDIFLERMGLGDHQAVYGLHYNTENYHVHIAVNRMHPLTLKVVQPHKGFDLEEAHKIVAVVEQKQGWVSEQNTRYTVLENGELARNRRPKSVQPRQEALAVEQASGEKSAQRIAQERGHDIIKSAASWTELHQKLAEKGLRFEQKGSGAIVFVGDIAVKASSVDRNFSMGKLCKRLGDFVPAEAAPPVKKIPPEPVSEVNLHEWQAYQAACSSYVSDQPAAEKQRQLDALKARQAAERKRILSGLGKRGFSVLNAERHRLKMHQRDELFQLRRQLRQQIEGRQYPQKGKPRFESWLRGRGLHMQADRWRQRLHVEKLRTEPPVQQPSKPASTTEETLFQQYIAAINADRVRVTCIRMEPDGEKKVFILDKKDGASKGFSPEELVMRLPEMLRLQQRGENIYYTPLSENRHHILIDDMTRESLEKFYADGFRPAVVLESSPENYQCVLTIPKLRSPHDRDVGNRITERLNREYGDKKLSGCIHPHRAAGFGNLKPKHRREDGSFPKVRLLKAEKCECAKAQELARRIAREYAAREAQKRQHPHLASALPHSADSVKAYYAHYENIRQHLTVEDFSRVDAMIALRLRVTGHSQQSVAEAVRQCAPTIREKNEGRDWLRYAERTAAYAFSVAGDVALAKNERYGEHWRKIEGPHDIRQESSRVRLL